VLVVVIVHSESLPKRRVSYPLEAPTKTPPAKQGQVCLSPIKEVGASLLRGRGRVNGTPSGQHEKGPGGCLDLNRARIREGSAQRKSPFRLLERPEGRVLFTEAMASRSIGLRGGSTKAAPLFGVSQAPTRSRRKGRTARVRNRLSERTRLRLLRPRRGAMPFDLKTASLRHKRKYSEPSTQLAAKSADAHGEQMAKHVIFFGGRRA